ncbi:MAG: hypothetical protein GXO91_02715 [FCB group bacterium]|nr:hypothetical protein [FCB group bacterium]
MEYQYIELHERYEGQVSEIILKPAPANVISKDMIAELRTVLREHQGLPGKKLLLFTGEGKHFSFGASVPEHLPGKVEKMLPEFHRFIGELLACEIPTLARVTGCCLGGGFELVLACSFIFADDTAKFAVPEITLGVFPPPACILLPGRCGEAFAAEMILTGEMFSGDRLLEKNVINVLSPADSLGADLGKFIETSILPKSAAALRITNKAVKTLSVGRYEDYIQKLETLYLKELMSTQDALEGLTAFLEKRSPKWKNE